MWQRFSFVRQLKLNLLRLLRLRKTPDEIAKGLALGVFIGMTPTFGFQMVLAVFFALLLKENRISALVGVWVTNPLTAPFIYAIEYETGRLLLGMERMRLPNEFSLGAFKHIGFEVLLPLGLGSLIYGILCGSLAYALTLRLIPVIKTMRISRWPRRRRPF